MSSLNADRMGRPRPGIPMRPLLRLPGKIPRAPGRTTGSSPAASADLACGAVLPPTVGRDETRGRSRLPGQGDEAVLPEASPARRQKLAKNDPAVHQPDVSHFRKRSSKAIERPGMGGLKTASILPVFFLAGRISPHYCPDKEPN